MHKRVLRLWPKKWPALSVLFLLHLKPKEGVRREETGGHGAMCDCESLGSISFSIGDSSETLSQETDVIRCFVNSGSTVEND